MKVDVFNMKGDKVETVELPAEIFETPVNVDLMHQAYIQQMANARLGTHKTKTRSEVSGGGRKPVVPARAPRAPRSGCMAARFIRRVPASIPNTCR
jgi:large subunit ribosomal protein L4